MTSSPSLSAIGHIRATANTWFHPYISRSEGTRRLDGCEAGSFILRESSKGGSYALSVVLPHGGGLGHYLVEKRGPDLFCLQGSENMFSSVEELLVHYCYNDSIGMPCRLRLPQRRVPQPVVPESRPALPPRNSVRGSPNAMRMNQSLSAIPTVSKSLPCNTLGGLTSPNSQHSSLSHSPQPGCLALDTEDPNETYEDMAANLQPSPCSIRSYGGGSFRKTQSFDDLDNDDEYVEMQGPL